MEVMDKHGFAPGNWTSRDFELRICCGNKKCSMNQWGQECVVPSRVRIDDSGMCEFYVKQLEHEKKRREKRNARRNVR